VKELKYLKKGGADKCTATKLVHKIIERLTWELHFLVLPPSKDFFGTFFTGVDNAKGSWFIISQTRSGLGCNSKEYSKRERHFPLSTFTSGPKTKKKKKKKINWKCFHFNPGHPLVAPVTKDPPRKVIIKRWHTAGSSSRRRWHWSRTQQLLQQLETMYAFFG
jgi:hypothetical protein